MSPVLLADSATDGEGWVTVPDTEMTEAASPVTVLGEKTIDFYSDLFKYWPFKVSEGANS